MSDTTLTLTFLGTSHGVPDVDRYCSSALLSVGNHRCLIDGGAPTADLLTRRGIPFREVKALFHTHVHSDHMLAGLPFLSLISWYYRDAAIDVFFPEAAACAAVKDILMLTDGSFDADRVRLHSFDQDFRYNDGIFRVTPIPTQHMAACGRPTYAFLMEAAGKRILFSGDMRADLADFPTVLYETPVDLFITECAHCGVDTLAQKLCDPRMKAARVLVTHIHPLPEKQPLFERLAKTLPYPLAIARDGMTVTF